MKIKIAVTDGVAALYREQFGEKWQNAIEKTITELNRRFTAQKGSNVRDYPADDFPFGEWEIDGVMVLFRVQGAECRRSSSCAASGSAWRARRKTAQTRSSSGTRRSWNSTSRTQATKGANHERPVV